MPKTDLIIERFNFVATMDYDPAGDQAFYNGPQVLHDALFSFEINASKLDVLDLGCGAGDLGMQFKSYSKKLDGVDLSAAMIAHAKKLEIYDNLVIADILTFCRQTANSYDVVISSDVVQYLEQLEELFSSVNRVLRDKGYFVFNVDKNYMDNSDYRPLPGDAQGLVNCHSHDYINRVAVFANFKVLKCGEYFDRNDWNSPDKKIVSMYYVMRKHD
jgi:predicted TPR repeat methyltransferase